jgi:hypothetical protein
MKKTTIFYHILCFVVVPSVVSIFWMFFYLRLYPIPISNDNINALSNIYQVVIAILVASLGFTAVFNFYYSRNVAENHMRDLIENSLEKHLLEIINNKDKSSIFFDNFKEKFTEGLLEDINKQKDSDLKLKEEVKRLREENVKLIEENSELKE